MGSSRMLAEIMGFWSPCLKPRLNSTLPALVLAQIWLFWALGSEPGERSLSNKKEALTCRLHPRSVHPKQSEIKSKQYTWAQRLRSTCNLQGKKHVFVCFTAAVLSSSLWTGGGERMTWRGGKRFVECYHTLLSGWSAEIYTHVQCFTESPTWIPPVGL